ncbi:MAG: type II toxin-antitoxin system YafQ family toxin [Desulfococcaceae bacterium]
MEALKEVLSLLAEQRLLPSSCKDHKLKGEWQDFRECHIESDWLLIYFIRYEELRPVRVGTHSELFGR